MSLLQALRTRGWSLSEDGLNDITEGNASLKVEEVISRALNIDLKEIGKKCLPDELPRGKIDSFDGNVVLQINNIKNINQPKSADKDQSSTCGGPQFLKVQLTDGSVTCYGLIMSNVSNLNLDVSPGTKLFLKPGKITVRQGLLLLDNKVCHMLGGKVQHMYERWELNRNAAKSARKRGGGQDGSRPPPWVPFGHKINSNVNTKGKSLDSSNVNSTGKENSEFDEQRKAVIAQAVKAKSNSQGKTFTTSGIKQVESATVNNYMSKTSNHPNKRITEEKNMEASSKQYKSASMKRMEKNIEDEEPSSHPSGQSTLFDFLNMKISLNNDDNNSNMDDRNQLNSFGLKEHQDFRNHKFKSNKPTYSGGNYSKQPNISGPRNNRLNFSKQQNYGPKFKSTDHPKPSQTSGYAMQNYFKQYPGLSKDRVQEQDLSNPKSNLRSNEVPTNFNPGYQNGANNAQNYYRNDERKNEFNRNDDRRNEFNRNDDRRNEFNRNDDRRNEFNSSSNRDFHVPFKSGDVVMAKYWEDQCFYPAVVCNVHHKGKTCVVRFEDFHNHEEVLCSDIFFHTPNDSFRRGRTNQQDANSKPLNYHGKNFEFRRGGGGRHFNETKGNSYDSNRPNQKRGNNSGHPDKRNQENQSRNQEAQRNPAPRPLYVPPAQRHQ